jgi:hypothetical protein
LCCTQWSAILTYESKLANYTVEMASFQQLEDNARPKLSALNTKIIAAQNERALNASKHDSTYTYCTDALAVVNRLSNFVGEAQTITKSTHDFVVPLYNAQGGDDHVNTLLGGAIQVLLGDTISDSVRKTAYYSLFVTLQANIQDYMKQVSEEEPAQKLAFETGVLPDLNNELTAEKAALSKIENDRLAYIHKHSQDTEHLPTKRTYYTVLMNRFNEAKTDVAKNTADCIQYMHSFAVKSQHIANEVINLRNAPQANVQPTPVPVFTSAPTPAPFCPSDPSCTGTDESPCKLSWTDINGGHSCVYSVTTTRRQKKEYQNPGWMPVYPSCIYQDSVGCALRDTDAEIAIVHNPSNNKIANFNDNVLNHFQQGSFSLEHQQISPSVCTATLTEAQLKTDSCYVVGCGGSVDNPCKKEWKTMAGKTVCLYSDVSSHRSASGLQNQGWVPFCPAQVGSDQHTCRTRPTGAPSTCNPQVQVSDDGLEHRVGAGVAAIHTAHTQAPSKACVKQNCTLTPWHEWNTCSKTCNGGYQSRTRGIILPDACGGAACESLTALRACNTETCVVPTPAPTPAYHGLGPCTHVYCLVEDKVHNGISHRVVAVRHKGKEELGRKHICSHNSESNGCSCKCYGQAYTPIPYTPIPTQDSL